MKKMLLSLFVCAQTLLMQGTLFAQDGGEPLPPRDSGLMQTVVMLAIVALFFYIILWRPEKKRRQESEKQRNALKKGDKVTAMGIIGTVSKVEEHSVILRMVDGGKIEVIKASITEVAPADDEKKKGKE